MDIFSGMERYRVGFDEQGNSRFAIPLEADRNGLLGRECPQEQCSPKYFKISVRADDRAGGLSDARLTCPYCGFKDTFQSFHTRSQVDWATAMVAHSVEENVVAELRRACEPINQMRGGLFGLRIDVNATPTRPIGRYIEEELKRVRTCQACSFEYAVYGVSYCCPFCGQGTLVEQLRESASTISELAAKAEEIGGIYGARAGEQILADAYKNVVMLFEGFLKRAYGYGISRTRDEAATRLLVSKVRTSFQRLGGAEEFFRRDLGFELFDGLAVTEQTKLARVFSKRHVFTHNLGLVDEKFRDQARSWQRVGEEVPVDAGEILLAVAIVEKIVAKALSQVGL